MSFLRSITIAIAVAGMAVATSANADGPNRYALIVGVSNYDPDQLKAVPSAQDECEKLAELFTRAGYTDEQLVVMTNGRGANDPSRLPTLANLDNQLNALTERAGRRDSLIIALAGHGLQSRDGTYLFCPFDGDLEDNRSLLSIEKLYATIEKCSSKHKLLLLDAMQPKPFSSEIEATVARKFKAVMPALPSPPTGTAVFVSCQAGHASEEGFYRAICKGIQGDAAGDDGTVTLPDIERYVKSQFKGRVRPVLRNNTAGLFTIVTQSLGKDETEKIDWLTRVDKYDEALEIVDRRLAVNPNDAIALAHRARIVSYNASALNVAKDYPKALEIANKAVRLAPNEPLPYVARAACHLALVDFESALADAAKASKLDPNDPYPHVMAGFSLFSLNDLPGVLREAKTAIEIDPDFPEARTLMVAYHYAKRDFETGFRELDRAIAVAPEMPALHFLYGGGYANIGKHDKAVESFSKAIELNDKSPGYLCRRALSYLKLGNDDAALRDARKAEQLCPKYPDVAAVRVMLAHKYADFEKSEKLMVEGLAVNPEFAELWQGRGHNLVNLRQYDKAIVAFNKALAIDHSLAESHMGIGMAYLAQKKYDEAITHLNRATRLKEHLSRAYFEKCQAYIGKKDYNAALIEIDKAIKYEPTQSVYKTQRTALLGAGARAPRPKAKPVQHKEITGPKAEKMASVNGKYTQLLKKLYIPNDVNQYGTFQDYGRWNEATYDKYRNLPTGYWVYVYPNWYIWKNASGRKPLARAGN